MKRESKICLRLLKMAQFSGRTLVFSFKKVIKECFQGQLLRKEKEGTKAEKDCNG